MIYIATEKSASVNNADGNSIANLHHFTADKHPIHTLPNHWQEQGKTYLNQKQNIVYKSIKYNREI